MLFVGFQNKGFWFWTQLLALHYQCNIVLSKCFTKPSFVTNNYFIKYGGGQLYMLLGTYYFSMAAIQISNLS